MNGKTYRKPFAKKSFGQNFLVDPKYIRKIIDALDLSSGDTVVEIGAGRGALTEFLVEKTAKVFAIELDRDLVPVLRGRFGPLPNFELVEADALSLDFSMFASNTLKPKLVANLPYNISTAILQHLIEHRDIFSEMVLMFQREVVDRITAPVGTKDRGFLTLLVEAAFTAERLFNVPGSAFRPAPTVTSSTVRLIPKDSQVADQAQIRKVLSRGFAQKRKTLLNNFKSTLTDANQILKAAGIDPGRRAETLTLDEWIVLAKVIAAGDDKQNANVL